MLGLVVRTSVCPVDLFCGHSNFQMSTMHVCITFINFSPNFEYGCCPMNDNQDGHQNGRGLMISACRRIILVIYHKISSKFHMYVWITFMKLQPKFE